MFFFFFFFWYTAKLQAVEDYLLVKSDFMNIWRVNPVLSS